jgi:transposase
MIDKRTIFEIHRLKHLGWSDRKIARYLRIDRGSVKKYVNHPDSVQKRSNRASKLDPYRDQINVLLDEDPTASAPVVLQRLMEGFDGKVTIVRDYLRQLRGKRKQRRLCPFRIRSRRTDADRLGPLRFIGIRRHPAQTLCPGRRRSLQSHDVRAVYHSQKQSALHGCLLEAFTWFGGSPKQLVVDNMATAVVERMGSVVRFNDAFLDFLRHFAVDPIACNPRSPYEKGKVESGVKYLRRNFMSLRTITDLDDVQHQVLGWLDTVANVRTHQTTGQRPVDRFEK